jgi:cysteine desulfuration protein SufE
MIDRTRDFLVETGELLAELPTREEQLMALRDYGDQLDPLDDSRKSDATFVPGCASATYIDVDLTPEGRLRFSGDSQSFISRGYIYILTHALSGLTPDEVLHEAVPVVESFAQQANVRMSMIASRANVFERIFHFMQKKTVEAVSQKGS